MRVASKMSSSADLKSMVLSFRVSELQVLLGFAGRSKSGKKHELMARAVGLVEKGSSTPVEIKIRELYKRRFPGGPPQSKGSAPAVASSSSPVKAPSSPVHHSQYSGQPPDYTLPSYERSQSEEYSSRSSNSHQSQIPIHPDVRFKRLPFYDVLGVLLKTSSLVPKSAARFQETFFIFHLTPGQARDIAMSRDLRPAARNEYSVQIQLRFCLLETTCSQKDEFPPSICVRINGKVAALPNAIPTNKPGVEPKRPSRPVNITSICRISPTASNHISISWASELGRSYCVCVDLVRKLNAEILLGRLKQKGTKHADHTRALIKEKLAQDPESEIATTSLRVSLLCPLGKMRMSNPSRAHTCNHLQCFDAPTFLQMNEKKPTWQCPVCDRPAEFDHLIIDGLFTEILKSAADATEIQFSENGEWQPMKQKEKGRASPEPITMIAGDDTPTSCNTPKKKEVDVIDLTETDDEDDDMPLALPASPYSTDSSPSVISSKPGCVSPPIISLDSPSRHSYTSIHSPPSLSSYSPHSMSSQQNRSPQSVTPLSAPRSPYASSSQNSLSPRAALHSPPLSPPSLTLPPPSLSSLPAVSSFNFPALSTSSFFCPPPAHSNSGRHNTPPPPTFPPMFPSFYGSDSMYPDTDYESLLGLVEYQRSLPPAAHQPFSLGPSRTLSPLNPFVASSSSSTVYEAGSYALPLTVQDRPLNTPSPPPADNDMDEALLSDTLMSTP